MSRHSPEAPGLLLVYSAREHKAALERSPFGLRNFRTPHVRNAEYASRLGNVPKSSYIGTDLTALQSEEDSSGFL